MRYELRIRKNTFSPYTQTVSAILEHLRYSGDRLLDWKDRGDFLEILLEVSSWVAHEKQIERAKSFGFEYLKTPFQKITQLSFESNFPTSKEKAKK